MRQITRIAVSAVLLYLGAISAFSQISRLFFAGMYVRFILFLASIVAACIISSQDMITIKQLMAFTVIVYVSSLPVDWFVRNTAVPDATSWGGLALHVVFGIIALLVALYIVARGAVVMEHLPQGS